MRSRAIYSDQRAIVTTMTVFLCSWFSQSATADRVVFSSFESQWSYLPGTAEASSPDVSAWRQADFDAGDWLVRSAPIGYGGGGALGTDLAAETPPMRDNYSSFFVRREFEVQELDSIVELHALLHYDDGIVVWINDQEVFRDNVPGKSGSDLPYDETATGNHVAGDRVDAFLQNFASFVTSGTNVVAAQIFNNTISSSDAYFDLELVDPVAPDRTAPFVTRILPPPGTTLRSLSAIEVIFAEPVTGIDAADLQIGGRPAESVTGDDVGPYLFRLDDAAAGVVDVSWADGHGIADRAPQPNAFDGGSWSYTVDTEAQLPRLVINELLAANGVGITDEDGDNEDWVELVNLEKFTVNVEGWSLTDNAEIPGKWLFPPIDIAPGEAIVVFASEKNRTAADRELHTNFKLSPDGEHLGLYNAEIPRQAVANFSPQYPPQQFDYSYGRSATGDFVYFQEPTPGEPNGDGGALGFVADPVLSVQHGLYTEPFPLTITTETPAAAIYYTLHGEVPTAENGLRYTEEVMVEPEPNRGGAVTLRVIAVHDDLWPSPVVTSTYIFPERVFEQGDAPEGFPPRWVGHLADYGLDASVIQSDPELALEALGALPTVSIVTDVDHLFSQETGIYANPPRSGIDWERPTSAELIFPDGRRGFQIDCGIRMQGRANTMMWYTRKISMRLLFKGDYGATKLRFPLYPDYDVTRFDTLILDAGMNNTWGNPNRDDQQMGQLIRDQYNSDLQNETGGYAARAIFVHVYLNGLYWGVYYMHERNDASWAAENFGCNKEDYDIVKHQQNNLVNGTRAYYNRMIALSKANLTVPEIYAALGETLDFHNLADYTLLNFYTGNVDWGHQNWYSSAKRGVGKWLFHSWDAERSIENVGDNATGRQNDGAPTGVFQNLRRNPEFRLLVADHAHKLFFNGGIFFVDFENPAWDLEHPERNRPAEIYNRLAEEVSIPMFMESARWGDMQRPGNSYKRTDWQRELQRLMTTYFPRRSRIVLGQLATARLYPRIPAPEFNQHGGDIEPGFVLMMGPEGRTIYYTLNGEDPRLVGGEVSPTALEYGGSITLEETTLVKARVLDGDWSALNEATFATASSAGAIVLSEIMYNPPEGLAFEFVEISNTSAAAVDLSGSAFTNGIAFKFPESTVLDPEASLVLVTNANAFAQRYPGVEVFGEYQGQLNNAGEKLTLKAAADDEDTALFSVEYNDASFWPLSPDGFGHSLVLDDVAGDPDDARSWRASAAVGGSPGEEDPAPAAGGVLVNEVLAVRSAEERDDFIELANVTGESIDVSGWFLSPARDTVDSLGAFRIPDGTLIPPGGFVSFSGGEYDFLVDVRGGGVYLSSAKTDGELTGHITGAQFDASQPGVSFGRYETSNRVVFTAMETKTPSRANSLPRSPDVVINEIHYHPLDGDSEFVELHNPTSGDVSLAGWRLTGISAADGQGSFTFSDDVKLSPNGYLLVVPTDDATFRADVTLPEGVHVIGPYGGGLNNAGERLRLFKPAGDSEADGSVLIDTVRFNDRPPWPGESDGTGPSLERIRADDYGNEVFNWAASRPTGGTPGEENSVVDLGEDVPGQIPGDLNQDSRVNITDAVVMLLYLFGGRDDVLPCDGGEESASNQSLLDANGDSTVDLSDPVHMLEFIFRRGDAHSLGTRCVTLEGCPEVCPARAR